DLIKSVKSKNPQFKNAEAREALEEGMRGFGSAGWRYAGCLPSYAIGGGVNACDHLIFEAANGDATAPPARASTAEPTHP
ncbi:MAG: hypothetical protein ACXVCV_15140, partial [Polyangia bacterium]